MKFKGIFSVVRVVMIILKKQNGSWYAIIILYTLDFFHDAKYTQQLQWFIFSILTLSHQTMKF